MITAALLLPPFSAFALPGYIRLSGDPDNSHCYYCDTAVGLGKMYVFHVDTDGATASEFKVNLGAAFMAVYLATEVHFDVAVGDPTTGISIGYGECLDTTQGPILLAMMSFFNLATTGPCAYVSVLPHPVTGNLAVVDCANNVQFALGGTLIVNPNTSCFCELVPFQPDCTAVATRTTTWGEIKALYE